MRVGPKRKGKLHFRLLWEGGSTANGDLTD